MTAILAAAVGLGAPAQAETERRAVAAAGRAVAGGLDADVRTASGRLLGHLHGDVARSGKGFATFRAAPGRRLAGDPVALVGGRSRGARGSLSARGHTLRLRLRVHRSGAVSGRGTLEGKRVRVSGVGRERLPRLRRGLRMLVVGKPRGEGYATLKRYFRPVPYRPATHTRRSLLRDRRRFHSFGALVFGRDVAAHEVRAHELLRSFYGAGKWVIAAPASAEMHAALGQVHPHVERRPAPAVAVRAAGPPGGHRSVKTTLRYPTALPHRSARQRRASARRRADWFLGELSRFARPHVRSAQRLPDNTARAAAAQVQDSQSTIVGFNPPYNATLIQIRVPYYHEFAVSGPQNYAQYKPCGWNQATDNAWCTNTSYWQSQTREAQVERQQRGLPDLGDKFAGCQWFLDNGYYMIDEETVLGVTGSLNDSGAYTVKWGDFDWAFIQGGSFGDHCPDAKGQTGNIQGNDYYYFLYDPETTSHTVIAASDPTISASIDGTLAHEDAFNGSGRIYWRPDPFKPVEYEWSGRFLYEHAWFLGAYEHELTLSAGPQVTEESFEYASQKSAPSKQITFTGQNRSESTNLSWNVGVFDTSFTGGYGKSQGMASSITVEVPDWEISPLPGSRTVTYKWTTNTGNDGTPLPWSTITGGGGGPFTLNDLNKADFGPAEVTTWTGDQTWGLLNMASTRTLHLVDHYSRYDGRGGIEDRFATKELAYGDNPDQIVPVTTNPAGAGLDLCDPNVMAPPFKTQCATAQHRAPAQATIMVGSQACQGDPVGGVAFTVAGKDAGRAGCGGQGKDTTVTANADAEVRAKPDPGVTVVRMNCYDIDAMTGSFVEVEAPQLIVPGPKLAPGARVFCNATLR
jgi:hypothetical protein